MKKRHFLYPGFAASLLCGLVLYLSTAHSQTGGTSAGRIAKTADVARVDAGANTAVYSRAAKANAILRHSLEWNFGGKPQTGWELYVPLISHAIETEADAGSPQFARAVSKWQASSGIATSGVIDNETFETFVRFWQSRRLGRSGLTGTLLSAPISEFYDATRSPDLLQLDAQAHSAYRKMIAAAAKELGRDLKVTKSGELAPDEKFLRIISAYRSPEYQASLRKKEPNAGRAALAKNSPHSTGYALDIYVGGEPVITKDANRAIQVKTPAYKWLVKNAHRFGFYPYFYEPWHWEYVPGK